MPTKKRKKQPAWPAVRRRGNSWEVYGRLAGQRRRRSFKDRQDAETYCADLRAERDDLRAQSSRDRRNLAVRVDSLTEAQRADVISAFAILDGEYTLTEAARELVRIKQVPNEGGAVGEIFAAWLESKEKANRRPRTIRDADSKVRPFAYEFEERAVASITTTEIEVWLDERNYTPVTRAAYLRQLHGFFAFAVKRGFVTSNPVAAIEKPTVEKPPPRIFTVKEVEKLLKTASDIRPEMIPYLAIGIFAGLRPENELGLLDWGDVDLEDKTIRVRPATAKKRRQRYVDIRDNLHEWLSPFWQPEGCVFFSRRFLRDIVERSGTDWSQDVMRHTFASYHLAMCGNAAATATQLGHSGNAATLFEHYRNLVRAKDAEAFWAIKPKETVDVIRLGSRVAG